VLTGSGFSEMVRGAWRRLWRAHAPQALKGVPEGASPRVASGERILFLDGWRCVAILLVMGYHYFFRWTPPQSPTNLYPYAGTFTHVPLFRVGDCGVDLFFVISGFVITLTLTRCRTIWEFAVRRFARLFPAMALCSIVTYVGLWLIPRGAFHRSWWAFLPSWTFIDPTLYAKVLHVPGLEWMDDSYWSLFVEVRFYALAGSVYFLAGRGFPPWFLFLSGVGFVADQLSAAAQASHLGWVSALLVSENLPWFLIGVGAYYLYKRAEARWSVAMIAVGVASLILRAAEHRDVKLLGMAVIIPAIFLASLRMAWLQRWLAARWMTMVGASSYGLYLLHQFLGVELIAWLGKSLPPARWYSVVWAVLVSLLLVGLSHFLFVHYENPANRAILRLSGRPHARQSGELQRRAAN
jgi:peptidoglycan/LPS O-acetylase OafA/YrhL